MAQDTPVFSVPTTYESLPVTIKAVQWDGSARHATDIIDWILQSGHSANYVCNNPEEPCTGAEDKHHLVIRTLEGVMVAEAGWWIIQGTEGEFYPCKDSVFRRKYRPTHRPEINISVPVINIQGGVPVPSPADMAKMLQRRTIEGLNRG